MKKLNTTLPEWVFGGIFYESVHAQSRIVPDGGILFRMAGGSSYSLSYLLVEDASTKALSIVGDSFHAKWHYNRMRWLVENGSGTYAVQLTDTNNELVSVVLNITMASSSGGYIVFSTYPSGSYNLQILNGVNSIAHSNPNVAADVALVFDRFLLVKTDSYSTKPDDPMVVNYNTAGMSADLDFGLSVLNLPMFNNYTRQWMPTQMGVDSLNGTISNIPFSDAALFPIFTLEQLDSDFSIELLSFNAVCGNERQTYTKVFSEQNNDYFDVERSKDGPNW